MVKNNISDSNFNSLKVSYAVVLTAAALLYIVSCAPGLVWQDSAMIQYRVWNNDIEGGLGLALAHPLFYVIAIASKYVPIGQFAYRVNLVSAITSALAVANLFLLLRLWLNKNTPALIAAGTFAISHTFFGHAVIPETYNLYTALLIAELIMLLQYQKTKRIGFLYALGLLNGLAIANHMLASIPLMCYAILFVVLLIQKKVQLKQMLIVAMCWITGALPYEYLMIKNIVQTGNFWAVMSSAVFGNGWQKDVLNTSLSLKIIKENILFFGLNFPTPNILLSLAGLSWIVKFCTDKIFKRIILVFAILFLLFAGRYTVPDRYAFFIPFYCMMAIFVGLGFHAIQLKMKNRYLIWLTAIFALMPIFVYASVPTIAKKANFSLGTKRKIPYRDDYEYFLKPWKTGYRGAQKFADEALNIVEGNAIIYADGTTVYPLLLTQQIGGKYKNVVIVSGHGNINNIKDYGKEKIDTLARKRNIYVVSPVHGYYPEFLEKYEFEQKMVLWKMKK